MSSHNVDGLVVIGAIIDLVVVGGVVHLWVPGEVNWPGTGLPLSHLVVEFDWGVWILWLSNPVHDVIIISGIIDSLRPLSSPVVSVHVDWWSLNTGLEVHHVDNVVLVDVGVSLSTSNESDSESIFHFDLKLL